LNARGEPLDQTADWPYLTVAPRALENSQFSPIVFRQVLDRGTELLRDRFAADEDVEELVRDRARLVDIALRAAWARHTGPSARDLALAAANCIPVRTSTSWCCCRRAIRPIGSRTSNGF
jgi:hypothetical protein